MAFANSGVCAWVAQYTKTSDDRGGREFVDVCVVSQYSIIIANERSAPVCTESAVAGIYLFHRPSKISFLPVPYALPAPIVYISRVRLRCVAIRRGSCEWFVWWVDFFVGWVGYLSSLFVVCLVYVVVRGGVVGRGGGV